MLNPRDYDEKRNIGRMTVECSMVYKASDSDEVYEGLAMDLSGSGILFACSQKLEPGMALEVVISLADSLIPPLDLMVEVVRVGDVGQGKYEVGTKITDFLGEE